MRSIGTASSWEDGSMRRESMEPASLHRNRAPASRATPRRRRVAGIALRVAIALTITLVLGEIAARLTGFVDRVNPFPRRLYAKTDAADLPYRLRPGVSLAVQGSHVAVNELGMRERPGISQRPAAGVHRVLVLGDSVAFGWLQEVDHAFPRRLEEELGRDGGVARGGRSERAEVLNAGVPGYNASIEAAWFRDYGVALAPDIVLVAVNLNGFDRAPHLNALGILSTEDDHVSPWSPANWSELYLALRWGILLARSDPRLARTGPHAQPAAAPTSAAG